MAIPSTYYDAIYLSPHLDDVALSCGGQIFQKTAAGESVLIVTIMAGDPPAQALSAFAQELHQTWQLLANTVSHRRQEDKKACHILQADHWHWSIPDCIYRSHPQSQTALYTSADDIFGPIRPTESALVQEIGQQLAALPPCGRLFVPLTVGNHVDHQITRLAAEVQFAPHQLTYYEDYPYVQQPGALEKVITAVWSSQVVPLTAAARQARLEAVAAFASQLAILFNGREAMRAQLSAYMAAVAGERLWYK